MGKSILITGCSSGIGLCAAKVLAQKGYNVIASARKLEDVERLKQEGLTAIQLDVDSSSSIDNAVQEVIKLTNGHLDALFNNSGFIVPGAVEDLSREMMRAQFETNVFGAMELTNKILPVMRKQGYGRIIQNSSLLGLVTMPYRGAYNASKFALEAFSSTLRQELYNTKIYVSIIAPGPILSHFRENGLKIYKSTLNGRDSVHKNVYANMEKSFFEPDSKDRKMTLQPEAVVDKLLDALESAHPKLHYYVGAPAHMFAWFRRLLPERVLDWFVVKISEVEQRNK